MDSSDQLHDRRRALKRIVSTVGVSAVVASGHNGAVMAQSLSSGTMIDRPFDRHPLVQVGVIGIGVRGSELLANMIPLKKVHIAALCDTFPERTRRAAKMLSDAGRPSAQLFDGTEDAWKRMCEELKLDLVVIATPWELHVPMAIGAMRAGAHVATEIPAATTLDGCWALVRESELTLRHCVLLENVCYGEEELLVLNMVKSGLFGTLVHCEGAYIHDLRSQLAEIPPNAGRGAWRRAAHRNREGDLYPTHGLGPIASYLGLNRGDVLDTIVSVSSRQAGLSSFVDRTAPRSAPIRRERFRCGDVTTSLLRTRAGVSIMLQHCVTGPRPYTRHNLVQGTEGTFAGFPPRIYLDKAKRGLHPEWRDLGELAKSHQHDLWKKEGETARALGGHGGIDYIMLFRLIDAMTAGKRPDIDVYDAAAWSCVSPLSAVSIGQGSKAVTVPDFTDGAWSASRKGFLA